MKISIAVPWYKSKSSVRPLYEGCLDVVKSIREFSDIEFIFVEDCGKDGTWEELVCLAHEDYRVKAVKLSRNFGQHHALTACLDLCSGDWVVVMDCDMQDRPDEIPRLWEKAREGFDMVCARRGVRNDPIWKRFSSRCYIKIFNWLSGLEYDGCVANFRILSSKVVLALRSMRETTRNMGSQLKWLGFNVGYIDVQHGVRFSGKSSYTLKKLFKLAFTSIIAYSNKPLRVSIQLGVLLTVLSIFTAAAIIFRKIFWGIPVSGWASIMISIWFVGGMITALLGVIGFYIERIYDETKKRPIYIIDKNINIKIDHK